jgi:lysophospholipase L1-like esterase
MNKKTAALFAALMMLVCAADAAVFAEESKTAPFREGEKILFLGDSITHGGWYVAQLQYIWQLRNPGKRATFVNCGICGNTAKSGLDRFDWDVAPEKPDRIFIMFGMNDVGHGGYWNPATADARAFAARRQRVADFKTNMKALIEKCRAIGARVTLITSTPYDQYSQLIEKAIVPGVNDPGICSLAMATRQLAAEEKVEFVDLYDTLTPILRDNPEIKFLADRVHPHEDGHLLMAALILKASGFSPVVGTAEFDAADGSRKFKYSPAALPLPTGKFYSNVDKVYPLTATLNSEVVRIRNLPKGTYRLLAAGVEIGVHSAAELAGGVNIATCDTPSQRKAKEGIKLATDIKKLAGGLRGLPQGYVQIMKRGGDINDQTSAFAKLDEWVEELRVANSAGGHYYRYYGGEVKRFKALYPKRDAEKARLGKLRDELFEFCRPEPFELSVEPIASKPVPEIPADRAVLKRLIEENVYGVRPVERPPVETFTQLSPDEDVFGGLGIRRRMKMTFGDGKGKTADVLFTAYIPKKPGRHPSFLLIAPHNPDAIYERVSPGRPHRMPVKSLLQRGFAGISYKNNDCALDHAEGKPMTNGVWAVFGPRGDTRTMTSWGAISAWAWGASRVMDWIETQSELDAGKVAVVGLSRCGKTALWAGASDERFALTISCCSGCGGAKLNRVDLPRSEHIANLKKNFPHWFANSYYSYADRDEEAPFDMHELVALVAPRLAYVTSASEDAWAGQFGEFESCRLASPAWERAGKKGLVAPDGFPPPSKPLQQGSVAYHMRLGRHDQTDYDWQRYMDFAASKGWISPSKGTGR